MHQLKGVIFSLKDVLAHSGDIDPGLFFEVIKLIKFLLSKDVQPVLISNTPWVVTDKNSGEKQQFNDYVSKLVGVALPYYQGGRDMGYKQTHAAMQFILDTHDWISSEVLYFGNTHDDVKAASNGGFPLLRATWHGDNSPYGFDFSSPKEIASFVDCCCLTPQDWFWGVEDGPLRVYSIAPLAEHSKAYPQGAIYSTNAKIAAKHDLGNLRFWGLLMAARIHLSGIGAEVNFVAPYPGHSSKSKKSKLMGAVAVVAGSLRSSFLYDLIERHVDAPKSQTLRTAGKLPNMENQLNSVHLNPAATKPGPKQQKYKRPPNLKGKTVLVVDDICTQGFSFEAARAFLEAAGASVILLSWLKTPGPNHYHALTALEPGIKKPFQPYECIKKQQKLYSNPGSVMNADAPAEIAAAYTKYSSWDWPTGL